MGKGSLKFHFLCIRIDLFRMYLLFSQCEVCGSTLENCFFQISSYLNIYILWFNFILGLNIIFFVSNSLSYITTTYMSKGKIMSYLYIKQKGKILLRPSRGKQNIHTPLLGKKNIQAKEVYRN